MGACCCSCCISHPSSHQPAAQPVAGSARPATMGHRASMGKGAVRNLLLQQSEGQQCGGARKEEMWQQEIFKMGRSIITWAGAFVSAQ